MRIEQISFHNSAAVRLISSDGDQAVVMRHGAQVVSWTPKDGTERIYLSDKADFTPGGAIRGGIPVCFPQFSNLGDGPFHGFARNQTWRFGEAIEICGKCQASFYLESTLETITLWPHHFRAILRVTIGAGILEAELEIVNSGDQSFIFTTALHTYLRVENIHKVTVHGLAGSTYFDKIANLVAQSEERQILLFAGQIDRVYSNVSSPLVLMDGTRKLMISAHHMHDVVIWNPWIERCQEIPDLPNDGYLSMICIEAGHIDKPVRLSSGQSWKGSQRIAS